MLVRHLMSTDVETLRRDDTFPDADVLMRLRRIRHLPVVDDRRRLVGLVTHRDLLRARSKGSAVEQMMTKDVWSVSPDTTVLAAARTLLDNQFGCLPVTDEDGTLVGILTEADFVRWAVEELSSPR